jgi:hypothetical protein
MAGHEVYLSLTYSVEVNDWRCTSAPPECVHGVDRHNFIFFNNVNSRTIIMTLTVTQLFRKSPDIHGTWGCISTFLIFHHWYLSLDKRNQPTHPYGILDHFNIIIPWKAKFCEWLNHSSCIYFSSDRFVLYDSSIASFLTWSPCL